ncbi:unnamed protein product, partial [Cladocopium goreaui]
YKGIGSIVCYLRADTGQVTWKHPFYDYFRQLRVFCKQASKDEVMQVRCNRLLWSYEATRVEAEHDQEPLISPMYVARMGEIFGFDVKTQGCVVRNCKAQLKAFAKHYRRTQDVDINLIRDCNEMLQRDLEKYEEMVSHWSGAVKDDVKFDLNKLSKGELQCVNCETTALSFCLECKDYLCLKCYGDLHSKGFRKSHAPFCLVPCALCVVLPAKIHCTFTDKSLCHGCYAMKHIKMLPKDGKENAPRRINYVEQYNRYAAMAKKRAETKASPSEEIPNLEDAAYESVLSTDWHPFYDARGVKYYHNFATGERMRQSPTAVPNTDEPGVEGNNGLKEAKAALGQEDESPRKEERAGSAPLKGSEPMPLSGFDSLKSDAAAAVLAAEAPETRTLRAPYRQLMPNEADMSEASLAGLRMTSLGPWRCASLHLFQDCLQLRSLPDCVTCLNQAIDASPWPVAVLHLLSATEMALRVDVIGCGSALKVTSHGSRWEVARCLLSAMSCWHLEANEICVNAASALVGAPWRALVMLTDMEEEVALCQAIDASAHQGQWQQPLAWLSASFQAGAGSLQGLAAAMTAANRQHWQFSLLILGMTHLRMQPDSVVLTCALAALEKASEWQAAGSLLEEMTRHSLANEHSGWAYQ